MIYLVLDFYNVHVSNEMTEFIEINKVKQLFIPQGYTDKLQPLDVI